MLSQSIHSSSKRVFLANQNLLFLYTSEWTCFSTWPSNLFSHLVIVSYSYFNVCIDIVSLLLCSYLYETIVSYSVGAFHFDWHIHMGIL